MTRDEAIEFIRDQLKVTKDKTSSYLPNTIADCDKFMPHEWVIELVIATCTFMDGVHAN